MRLTSLAFASGDWIPVRFTCDGANWSPPLAWTAPPTETRSLALVCADPDAPSGTWYHWAMHDIPRGMRALEEHWTPARTAPPQAPNDFGHIGYGGPCPPLGAPAHRYHFLLSALNVEQLALAPQTHCCDVEVAARAHAITTAGPTGRYRRTR